MADKDESFFRELVRHHVSGQLKVAPEHCAPAVLDAMGKPHIETYKKFQKRFYELTKGMGMEQYLVPYLMSSHPGSTIRDAIALACFLKEEGIRPEQVQDFYPTPGTISTCMFYTGLDPYTMQPIYVPRTAKEKAEQRAMLQYFKPENDAVIRAALIKAGRRDLIGNGPHCLIPAVPPANAKNPHDKHLAKQNAAKGGSRSGCATQNAPKKAVKSAEKSSRSPQKRGGRNTGSR